MIDSETIRIVRFKKTKSEEGNWMCYRTADDRLVISVDCNIQPKYKTIGDTKMISVKGTRIFLRGDGTAHIVF